MEGKTSERVWSCSLSTSYWLYWSRLLLNEIGEQWKINVTWSSLNDVTLNVPGMFISLISLQRNIVLIVHHIPALDHHVQLVITQRPECGTKKTYLFIYLFSYFEPWICLFIFLYFCLNIPTGFSVTFVRKFFQVTHFFKDYRWNGSDV